MNDDFECVWCWMNARFLLYHVHPHINFNDKFDHFGFTINLACERKGLCVGTCCLMRGFICLSIICSDSF